MENSNELELKINNYIDTISIFVNDEPIEITPRLSLKAGAKGKIRKGNNIITIKKDSFIGGKHGIMKIFFDWVSAVFGAPTFTLKEVSLDTYSFELIINIIAKGNETIVISLNDLKVNIDYCSCEYEIIKNEIVEDEKAQKRVKIYYKLPVLIMSTIIVLLLFIVSILLIISKKYLYGIIELIMTFFLCNVFFKPYKSSIK